jgi:hypothetical protein
MLCSFRSLERFEEDALQFNLCLNGGSVGGDGSNKYCRVVDEVGDGGEGGEMEMAARKGSITLLGRVLQKVKGEINDRHYNITSLSRDLSCIPVDTWPPIRFQDGSR